MSGGWRVAFSGSKSSHHGPCQAINVKPNVAFGKDTNNLIYHCLYSKAAILPMKKTKIQRS